MNDAPQHAHEQTEELASNIFNEIVGDGYQHRLSNFGLRCFAEQKLVGKKAVYPETVVEMVMTKMWWFRGYNREER